MQAVARTVRHVPMLGLALGLLLAAGLALVACGGSPERSSPAPTPLASEARSSPGVTALPSSARPSPTRTASRSPSATPSGTPTPASPSCPANNALRSWYYVADESHRVPAIPDDVGRLLRTYDARYVGATGEKVVYLTFDEGYENGFTGRILDELLAARVTAAFFVTGAYVRDNPDLVRRMVAEGHVVGNHTGSHPSLPSLAGDADAFERELMVTEKAFRRATGSAMARLVRPPKGEYSARSLCLTRRIGYTTVFWSFAHRDWLVDDQPSVETTVERVLAGSHRGAVYLLHAVSRSNAEALPAIIAGLRAQGYRLRSPAELR
jgi:peptidoglycan-N-acetylmuramic acid deacetylase